jgi:hypothetical protein
LIEIDVLDMKMVGLERRLRRSDAFVDVRQEDPSLRSSIRILEPLQDRSQGAISCVAGLFALIQELIDRGEVRHYREQVIAVIEKKKRMKVKV